MLGSYNAQTLEGEPEEDVVMYVRQTYDPAPCFIRVLLLRGRMMGAVLIGDTGSLEETFENLIVERHVRPTILSPLWRVAGFALGAATARMGPRAAMACTVAVEEVIDEHYREQAERLGTAESSLKTTIEEFRVEELEHRDTALEHEAERAVGYPVLSAFVKAGSRAAIWLSTRI